MLDLLRDESANPRQYAPHGQVGLPLAARVVAQLLQQLEVLLSALTGRPNIIKKTGVKYRYTQ